MRFTVDSNILIYSIDAGTPDKHAIAKHILSRAVECDAFVCTQALGEFLSVIGRKFPAYLPVATEQAARWATLLPVIATTPEHLVAGANLRLRYRLQFWDSVLLEVSRSAGATAFITEDMQDGANLEGVLLLNPFLAKNRASLDLLLQG